jgi:hypothetical protein
LKSGNWLRKLKGSGNYLRNKTLKNFAKASICFLAFAGIFFLSFAQLLLTLQLDILTGVGLLTSLILLIIGYFYLKKYRTYKGGWEGEKQVYKLLNSKLSDDYYLINELKIGKGGDLDHVVLGPNGVFVIETKNWSGKISCQKDEWQRQDRHKFNNSPSRQVKNNTNKIRRLLEAQSSLRNHGVWIEGIVVFTNPNIELQLNKPTVTILRLPELPDYITNYKNFNPYTTRQLELIIKVITNKTR